MTSNSSPQTGTLVVLMLQHHLAAWQAAPQQPVHDLPIEGEINWLPTNARASCVPQSLADLDERVGCQLPLLLVYDAASQPMLEEALPQSVARFKGRNWQIVSYDKLRERFAIGLLETALPPRDWIAEQLLPMLLAADDISERERLREATRHQHESLSEQMQQERQSLERENETLRRQIAALRTVDAERLITFLPALFPRVFSVLNGRDLALLTGRIEPYALPNPYPEPSEESLFVLQRKFRVLPREQQAPVVAFMAELPQRQLLKPRAEMRDLVLELESEVLNGRG
ncbi:hypothetical protein SJS80_02610 [Aeromonas caviae]|uniref:hypothetical protein n=1 Tax=Aeromonas caviae TaxID=648 RepID=UPI0029D91CCF|nr:hypothetical protein [Aeromonas caviae]MDX7760817.1 hypothetical protein [Aeromonas caviae]